MSSLMIKRGLLKRPIKETSVRHNGKTCREVLFKNFQELSHLVFDFTNKETTARSIELLRRS